MDRYWFFTWRTYGTWLPGADGFVGYYRNRVGDRVIDNAPGFETCDAIPQLEDYSREIMKGEPVLLVAAQAPLLLAQFQETSGHRKWAIDAVAIMVNHIHIVYGVTGDPDPSGMLRDWKSYGSRALNRLGPRRDAGLWWAGGGSKRPLKTQLARYAANAYVRDQENPLLIWLSDEAKQLLGEPAA